MPESRGEKNLFNPQVEEFFPKSPSKIILKPLGFRIQYSKQVPFKIANASEIGLRMQLNFESISNFEKKNC